MERLEFSSNEWVHFWLYRNITNVDGLLALIVGGKLEVAAVNATLIPCRFVVDVAAWKALCDSNTATLMTKNVHSEVVFNVSPDMAITRSLKMFGMSAGVTTDVLFVLVNGSEAQRALVESSIKGDLVTTGIDAALAMSFDSTKARQCYDVTDVELRVNGWRNAIVNRISCKVSKKSEMTM